MKTANDILKDVNAHAAEMKTHVVSDMKHRDIVLVLWGVNVFGSTSYPMITDPTGKSCEVKGLYLSADGQLYAVTSVSSRNDVTGVVAFNRREAERRIDGMEEYNSGTPEEWSVICDCYNVAARMLDAEKLRDAPQPWW